MVILNPLKRKREQRNACVHDVDESDRYFKACKYVQHILKNQAYLMLKKFGDTKKKISNVEINPSTGIAKSAYSILKRHHSYQFDGVYPPETNENDIYLTACPNILIGILSGIDGCIVSYHNYNVKDFNVTPSLVTYSVRRLFEHIDRVKSGKLIKYDVEITILEVLNDCSCVKDLITKSMQNDIERNDNFAKIEVRSAQKTLELLQESFSGASCNSSLVVTLYVTKRDARISERVTSKLHLITVVEPQKDQKKVLREELLDRPVFICLEDSLKRCACDPSCQLGSNIIYNILQTSFNRRNKKCQCCVIFNVFVHATNEPEVTRYLELGDYIYNNRCVDTSSETFCGRPKNEHYRRLLEVRKCSIFISKETCPKKHAYKCETKPKATQQLFPYVKGSLCSMAPDELRMTIKIIMANDKSIITFNHTKLENIQEEEEEENEETSDLIEMFEVHTTANLTLNPLSESQVPDDEVAFRCKEGCINYGCDLMKMCRHERAKRLKQERIRRTNLRKQEEKERNKQKSARLLSLIKPAQVQKYCGKLVHSCK